MMPLSPPFKYGTAFGGQAKLILLDVSFLQEEEVFERALWEVSPARQEKVRRFKVRSAALESLGAGLVLDEGLSLIGVREKEAPLLLGEQGKPYIKRTPPFHFNLSHSKGQVLGIFSRWEAGCDIQEENKHWSGISQRFFHPLEQDYISSRQGDPEKRRAFFRLWALKESFIKATGAGLSAELSSFCICIQEESVRLASFNGEDCKALEEGGALIPKGPGNTEGPWRCQLEELSLPGPEGFHMAGCLLSPLPQRIKK